MRTGRLPAGPLIGAAALLTLLLHAWLARYAHPMADDLTYALRDVSQGVWDALRSEHLRWNGRYASNLLVLYGPLRLGMEAIAVYRLVPVALMALTFLAAWVLARTAAPTGTPAAHAAFGALLWTALFLHATPDIGEALYWYTGAVTYQLAGILLLIHLALIAGPWSGRQGVWRSAAALITALLLPGFNEVVMLLLVLLHTGIVVAHQRRGGRIPARAWLLLGAVLLGALVVATAPGNAVREAHFPLRHRPGPSLGMSMLQTARFLVVWCSSPVVVGCALLALARRERLLPLAAWVRRHRLALLLLPPAITMACVFPAYWSTGVLGQYRTLNLACLLVVPMLVLLPLAWSDLRPFAPLLRALSRARWQGLAVLLAVAGLFVDRNGERALGDLLGGRAAAADHQLWDRYARLRDCSAHEGIALPPLTDPPRSIGVLDIRTDPGFAQNRAYAAYFGCGSVRAGP